MKRPDELFAAHVDGRLSDDESAQLRQLLASDAEARRAFARWMLLEQGLTDHFEGTKAARAAVLPDTRTSRTARVRRFPVRRLLALAAMLLVAAGVSFLAARERKPAAIAMVIEASADVAWDDAAAESRGAGTLLSPGAIRLRAGVVRLLFSSGALVTLQGPAEFALERSGRASLQKGRLTAHVPPRARGFVVDSGNLRATDLGTEFGMSAEPGRREVHVFDGRVDVQVAKSTNGVMQLTEGQALSVGPDRALDRMPARAADFELSRPDALLVTPAYVQTVRAEGPAAYWRFESVRDGRTPNEMSDAFAARLVGRASVLVSGINGHLDFARASDPGCLRVDEPLPLKGRDYSVEFWFRPEAYDDGGTVVSLVEPGSARRHAMLIEKAVPGPDDPAKFNSVILRFLHRDPPGSIGGTNLYAYEVIPGRWHHVVATKEGPRTALYLDGRLVTEGRDATSLSIDPAVVIGQMLASDRGWFRLFAGSLDEVAIYAHALDAATVRTHFRLLRPDPAGPST